MRHRKFAGLIAGIMSIACLCTPLTGIQSVSAEGYSMKVSVNLSGEKKEISPYIYGVNQFNGGSNCKNVTVNALRQGGNRFTGYNWETNWSNAGEDWKNSSDTYFGDTANGPGFAVRGFSKEAKDYDVAYKLATLQMAGYVAADKDGTVSTAAPSDRWNEVKFRKDGALSLEPDLTDNTVYMDEYVNYIIKTLGDSSSASGIQGYSLDNEPFLWNDTHPYLHSEECGAQELIDKSIELAKVVKELDPNAEVFGPALWGMLACIQAGTSDKFTDPVWESKKGNYDWYLDYYLESMKKAEEETGKRLLDVVDVHYYSQDCSTDDGKLQAARSLYDETYKENSWLQPYFGKYFPLLPNIQKSIDKYYPGTKIAISEYNLADISNEKVTGKSVLSAIAETEALGAFADNNVYFATYWGTLAECPYVESAINLYTNYDGNGASFGDTLVETKTEDISKSAAFAAVDGNDDSEVTVVLSNKDKTNSENAVINIAGSSSDYKSAVVYAVTQDHSDIRIIDVQNNISGDIEVTLPPLSVAQVVISDQLTDKTVYEEPDIEIKETVYNADELSVDAEGAKLIPLGDKEHLKEIVFGVESSSTAGSAYYSGGGAICFSKLTPIETGSGKEFWGFKGVNFSNGQTEITVPFDEYFTNADQEEVKASVGDDTAVWQQSWWNYSEKDEKGADVVVKYTTVKLVYEYDNTVNPVRPEKGDVNIDGAVNTADIVALTNWLLNMEIEIGANDADINSDNVINVFDLVLLKRIVMEI